MSDTYQQLVERLTKHFPSISTPLSPDSTFVQLGLDSLHMVELSVELSDQLGVDVDGLTPDSTIQDAVELVEAHVGEGGLPPGRGD